MRTSARAHDTAYATARRLLGSKTAWIRDIDRAISPEELILAGARAGIEPELALRTCMWPLLVPAERGRRPGISQGILVTGIYHRERLNSGLQFCPLCLEGDADPHFRKQWRLALWTRCPIHSVLLRCACQHCASPIALHRTSGVSLCVCHRCGWDQRKSISAQRSPATEHTALLQSANPDACMKVGALSIDYPQWLGLLRDLWRLLTLDRFRENIQASAALASDSPAPRVEDLMERTAPDVRDYWLSRLLEVMAKGLPELISICQSALITRGELRAYRRSTNSEVLSAISQHLAGDNQPRRPRPKLVKPRLSNLAALTETGLGEAIQRNLPLFA